MNKDRKQKYRTRIVFVCLLIIFSMLLVGIGGSLNKFIVNENGGRMPFKNYWDIPDTKTHFGYYNKEEVKFWWGTDIFLDNKKGVIFSIGDIIVDLGIYLFYPFLIFGILFLLNSIRSIKNEQRRIKKTERKYTG